MPRWPDVALADLASPEDRSITKPYGSSIVKEDYRAAGVPVVRGVNLGRGRFHDDDFVFISEQLADTLSASNLGPGDLVFTHRGSVGQVSMIPREPRHPRYACSTSQVKARLDPRKAVPEFYFYWFQSPAGQRSILANLSTVGVPGLVQPTATVKSLRVPHPPIEEQRGIAAALGALDDKIESNRRAVACGLELIDASARSAGSAISNVVPLGEMVDVAREILDPAWLDDAAVDHFSIPAFDAEAWPERVGASTIKSSKQILRRPSVLLSRLNPRFNRTWWTGPLQSVPALASTEFLALTAPDDLGLARTWIAVRDSYFIAEFARRVTGTSGSHQRTRPDDALAIEVPDVRLLPDGEVERAAAVLRLLHQSRRESRRLAALRDALLPELLWGQLRVDDTQDQLLDRTAHSPEET